jgi:uncharacterized protein HemY
MEWIPTVFITFKVVVLAIGMFYAVKWHYDQGKKRGTEEQRAVLRNSGKLVVLFLVLAVVLLFVTFTVGKMLGLDLNV